jgi:Uma2 family endonuclease
VPQTSFGSWKTWDNGGAPDLAVEIVSPNEGDGVSWEDKLARYHELGVKELVRFDPEALEGARLRVWDRVRGDLVERVIRGDRTPCLTLGLNWTVCPVDDQLTGLRLVDDEGRSLETEKEAAARARAEAEERARTEARAREDAEARIRALEEQLARVRGSGR